MRLRPYVLVATALLYPTSAAASSPETSVRLGGPKPACRAEGTRLEISAEGSEFDRACLAAPADQPFTIAFENRDTAEHNVAILGHHGSEGPMFRGKLFAGPEKVTYEVGALPAGIYHFHCEAHQTAMMGIFAVDAPDGMPRPMAGMPHDTADMNTLARTGPSRFRPLLVLAGSALALAGMTMMGPARRTARRGTPAGR